MATIPGEAPRIEPEEAKALFDRGDAVFLDVRRRSDYDEAHIPGALSAPSNHLDRLAQDLPRDRRIITY